MTQRLVQRPARIPPPDLPLEPLVLVAPPAPFDSRGGMGGIMQVALPLMGGAGSVVLFAGNRSPLLMIAGGLMLGAVLLGGVAVFIAMRTGSRRRAGQAQGRYLDYLSQQQIDLATLAESQRAVATLRHPEPRGLLALIDDPARLWERRRHDPDFLVVRIGAGADRLSRPLGQPAPAGGQLASPDPLCQAALERLILRGQILEGMPLAVPLAGSVSLVGEPESTRALLRALLTQLAVLHAPDDVRLALSIGPTGRSDFEWVKWFPHLLDVEQLDGPVARRLVARDETELAAVLRREIGRRVEFLATQRRAGSIARIAPTPRLIVVADRSTGGPDPLGLLPESTTPEELGLVVVTVVEQRIHEPGSVQVRVTVSPQGEILVEDLRPAATDPKQARLRRVVAGATRGQLDVVSPQLATAVARRLAPLRLQPEPDLDTPLESTIDLAGLVGVTDVGTYDIATLWSARGLPEFLRVPFGLGHTGQKIHLDLKESAQHGMGPHGLCVGATGSGKSEVLRTLVLTLAMTHPPDRLSLVLVDYKGGATFAGLEDLPQTAAMVSNLSDDTGLVDRLADALRGEINRRQQLLLWAGSLANTTAYNARRNAGQKLPPLPNLLVVIDEFGEMLTAKPEMIELFLQIGRIGRSIGVHLLLASQRLEEGRLRGLESYLSFRLGLRTFNEAESRTVLGRPDAYQLPPIPGSGYLKVDTTLFERFKAAYVSGTYHPTSADETPVDLPAWPMPYPLFNDAQAWLSQALSRGPSAAPVKEDQFAPTTLDVVVGRLRAVAAQVPQIWLPPLPDVLPLNRVLGPLAADPRHGLSVADPGRHGRLRFPIGLLDRPAEQWQGPLELDLSGGGGHLAILGAPQSGKSGAVRALIAGAALTHTPLDVAFYCVDLGGGGLGALDTLPHIGGVAGRLDPDRVRRTVAEVANQLTEREQLFASHRLDSVETMRTAHRAGRVPWLPVADVFLVIDNWAVFKEDFDDLTDIVAEIATRGLGYGVHLILATGRWADLRMQLQAAIGTKLELRLNDPLDSTLGRKAVENIRANTPGRCVIDGGLSAQLALPRIDDRAEVASAQDGLDALVKQVNEAWPGNRVPEIRMLPDQIDYTTLRGADQALPAILIGVDEGDLLPVRLDLFDTDQHLVVFGDSGSGKTNLCRVIIRDLIDHYTEDQVVFALFDLRRTLLDVIPEPYLGAYAGTAARAAGMATGVAEELTQRMPPDDVTTAQLKDRSWWKGPEIVVLADDFDLLSPSGVGPLAPLLEFLPQARDLGLHVVLLRRSGGASRAVHEPAISRLKELGATALLLSGDRQEGQLWPGAYLSIQPPGRGLLVRRGRRPARIQTAFLADE